MDSVFCDECGNKGAENFCDDCFGCEHCCNCGSTEAWMPAGNRE